jgi:hypothetical protein
VGVSADVGEANLGRATAREWTTFETLTLELLAGFGSFVAVKLVGELRGTKCGSAITLRGHAVLGEHQRCSPAMLPR